LVAEVRGVLRSHYKSLALAKGVDKSGTRKEKLPFLASNFLAIYSIKDN
jgi:hypothetical protein